MKVSKHSIIFFALLLPLLILISTSNAIIIDNGDGTVTQIRNDGSVLMWLQDANYSMTSGYDSDGLMNWQEAMDWANTLSFAGHSDWRLPPADISCGVDPYTWAYNCINSEMGHIFYTELGGTASSHIHTSTDPDVALFSNMEHFVYWLSTEYVQDYRQWCTNCSWTFGFDSGDQNNHGKSSGAYAWAVRDGDVTPVPEPTTMLLLASGLVGLVWFRRKYSVN